MIWPPLLCVKQVISGNISGAFVSHCAADINLASRCLDRLVFVKSCCIPTLLQHPACADAACTTTPIYQSHWFHIEDDRFIVVSPPSDQADVVAYLCFLCLTLCKVFKVDSDCQHFFPLQQPPAWPVKSRKNRATLELNQLLKQLSLLAPPRSSCVRRLEDGNRELRGQNCTWLCVF